MTAWVNFDQGHDLGTGLAGAIDSLSRDDRDYLVAGGLGILIGDGQLNYRPESVIDTF